MTKEQQELLETLILIICAVSLIIAYALKFS